MWRILVWVAVVITLVAGGWMSGIAGTTPAGALPMVVAEVPAQALVTSALAGGTLRVLPGERGRLVLVTATGRRRVLTGGFHSAADPDVSFDGRRILFSGRRTRLDPWCVWEMQADGTGARRITCGAAGARQPIYQSPIFTITPTGVEPWVQIAFVGENPGERNEAGVASNTSLWSCKTDGSALQRLTFNLSNDMDPVVLPDGRMVYAGWLRTDRQEETGTGRVALVGVNEDGTDYQIYAGPQGFRVKQMPAPTTTGLVVFVESPQIAGDGSGRLAAVSQARPFHSYRPLSTDTDGWFRAPAPLPDGRVLVAWRPDEKVLFAIQRFDPDTRAREDVFTEPGWHAIQAKVLAPRTEPDARSSVVHADDPLGTIYTVDVNIHDLGDRLPRGTSKTLRVLEGVPATADRAPFNRLLGEVPLAADGSYQMRVPANTPVRLQLLDAHGAAVRTSSWLWVRNHAAQGCVGCHEDPERTPPNRLMRALASAAPVLNPPIGQRRRIEDSGETR